MPLNEALVGKRYPAATYAVSADATKRYARAYNEDNPWFLDESRAAGIIAPPLFGVVVVGPALVQVVGDPALNLDFRRALHGEQDMEFLTPLRPGDTISTSARIEAIETKATGETLVVALESANQRREPVQRILFNLFVRASSGSGQRRAAPSATTTPSRPQPLFTAAQTVDRDQTYRYAEASGDHTPIHLDDAVAKAAGLPGIIVHGLCTMAFVSKVMIDRLCGGDPTHLRRLKVRFARPVLPGQTIATTVWRGADANGRRVFEFETRNPEGVPVITGGIAEVSA
jgi:acyl dehydratase